MSHWIIYALFIYIVYKFVRSFFLPAMHITNTMNSKMKEMQEKMNEMNRQQQKPQQPERSSVKKEGEYIDYEEVK
jgi:membrane protein insertase Oxa1/YidC/SpoIIIJ